MVPTVATGARLRPGAKGKGCMAETLVREDVRYAAATTALTARPAQLSVIVPTFNEAGNVVPLLERIQSALRDVAHEVIFIDDNSPDRTADAVKAVAARDPTVRCIRRLGRRGLAGACIEGILSSSAPYVAVIDGDLQHDETLLARMLQTLRETQTDLVIGSRYVPGGSAGAFSAERGFFSRAATRAARALLRTPISDPMSGFFMMRRTRFEEIAERLSPAGFKILLDIVCSGRNLHIVEEPYIFRARAGGTSKFDLRAMLDFAGLLVAKLSRNVLDPRFLPYALIGATGLCVHLATLKATFAFAGSFARAQALATLTAMMGNFFLNNLVTYRDRRLRGWNLVPGLAAYCAIGAMGAIANIGLASWLYAERPVWWAAGFAGALIGALWNYMLASQLIWHTR